MKSYALLVAMSVALVSGCAFARAQSSTPHKLANVSDIRLALTGKLLSYSPSGWADAGMAEGFRADGTWYGTYFSRGPIGFSGQWKIEGERVCVIPDTGSIVAKWSSGSRCRTIWRDGDTGFLLMEHLQPKFASLGPVRLAVTDLPSNDR